jgi:hypothetical protein
LQPVREQHPANEPAGGDGEATLVEGHERHHIPRGRAWHRLVGGNDPLDGIGEGRKLAHLDQTEELLVGDIGARPVGNHDSEVLGELEAHTAAVLRMRKNSERKGQVREEEEADGEAKSRTSAPRAVLKGADLTPHLRSRARRVSETFAHARSPAKQPPTRVTAITATTATNKSSRMSLQLTHELGGYIWRMRSCAPTENLKNTTNTKIDRLSLSTTPRLPLRLRGY